MGDSAQPAPLNLNQPRNKKLGPPVPRFICSVLRGNRPISLILGQLDGGADGMFERALSSSVVVASMHAFMLSTA
jgi:hypothetical protein